MDIAMQLEKEHSKKKTLQIMEYIGNSPERFAELWTIIQVAAPPLPQRAAWVLSHTLEVHPLLAQPWLGEMIDKLQQHSHDAIHRAIVRSLAIYPQIPNQYHGILFDWSIDCLLSPTRAVAIKIHTMEIAASIATTAPELCEELAIVINEQMDLNSVGFKSKGKKVLKRLKFQ